MADVRVHGAKLRLSVGALVLVVAGLSRPAQATCPAGRATGARGNTLEVGFTAAPPFVITGLNDREVRGVAIDLLRALATQEGWHLALKELSPQTLRARLAACELDVGMDGVAVSAALAETLELSQPYLSTVTTVIVKAEDEVRAAPAARGHAGRLVRGILRSLAYGLAALGVLAIASWLLNAFSGFPGGPPLRLRRIDSTVSGPWAGLRWLWRSTTGRVLVATWVGAGIAIGVTGALGAAQSLVRDGDDRLRAVVERAAHNESLVGERYPDGAPVSCAKSQARDCFHGFGDGTLAAIAGLREVLCLGADQLSLDDAILRDDLAIPEQLSYLLPPGSPLRSHLDAALLRHHERARVEAPLVRCPGDPR